MTTLTPIPDQLQNLEYTARQVSEQPLLSEQPLRGGGIDALRFESSCSQSCVALRAVRLIRGRVIKFAVCVLVRRHTLEDLPHEQMLSFSNNRLLALVSV
jgi:hypothetical protein